MGGTIRSGVAVAALVWSLFAAVVFTRQLPLRNTASVCVELTTRDHLPGTASVVMRDEATRIWQRHRVALSWSQRADTPCDDAVPVIFDDEQVQKIVGAKRVDVLAVTRFVGRSRTIFVSAVRGFQLLTRLQPASPLQTETERALRGGALLGRVVAHELGHVLLTTTSHSDSGLMRPVYGAGDLLADDDRMIALMPSEESRLAMRYSLVPVDSPTVLAAGKR